MGDYPNPFETTHFARPKTYGAIYSWSGSILDIPEQFRLCDGTNGTPDLRDKFIVGSGDTYGVGAVGGFVSHQHLGTTDGHTHTSSGPNNADGAGTTLPQINSNTDNFITDNADSRPPYYSLAFIMETGL